MKTRWIGLTVSSAALLALGCGASAPSKELMTARNAYAQARNSEAAELNPAGVHDAYKALQAAENAHADDAGSSREKHYAYLAARKAERAIAEASAALAKQEQQRADDSYRTALQQRTAQATEQQAQYAQQLDTTQRALQENSQTLQQRDQALQQKDQELEATRQAAERAQQELRQAEAMREEAGRTIISLSGVLFQTGGAELSGPAERRLDTVASALGTYTDRNIVVEGHTDAQGSDAANRELSQRRAEAVRSYLIGHGVPAERLRAVGRGEESPVASNETADGRANNRRVEIVIEPKTQPAAPAKPAP